MVVNTTYWHSVDLHFDFNLVIGEQISNPEFHLMVLTWSLIPLIGIVLTLILILIWLYMNRLTIQNFI